MRSPSLRSSLSKETCSSRSRLAATEPASPTRVLIDPWFSAASRVPLSRDRAGTLGASEASSSVLTSRSSAWNRLSSGFSYLRSSSSRTRPWKRSAISDSLRSRGVNAAPERSTMTSHRSPSGISSPSLRSSRRRRSSSWTSFRPVRSRCSAPDRSTSTLSSAGESGYSSRKSFHDASVRPWASRSTWRTSSLEDSTSLKASSRTDSMPGLGESTRCLMISMRLLSSRSTTSNRSARYSICCSRLVTSAPATSEPMSWDRSRCREMNETIGTGLPLSADSISLTSRCT